MSWVRVDPTVSPQRGAVISLGPYREMPTTPIASLERKWRNTETGLRFFLTFFAVMWNSTSALMLGTMLKGSSFMLNHRHYHSFSEAARHDRSIYFMVVVMPLIGIVVGYVALALFVNRTRVSVSRELLTVQRGPLPWRNAHVQLRASDLRQLYVERYQSHTQNNRPVIAFRVVAEPNTGPPIIVDRGLGKYEDARALEVWIEKQLGINDVPVRGEAERVQSTPS